MNAKICEKNVVLLANTEATLTIFNSLNSSFGGEYKLARVKKEKLYLQQMSRSKFLEIKIEEKQE